MKRLLAATTTIVVVTACQQVPTTLANKVYSSQLSPAVAFALPSLDVATVSTQLTSAVATYVGYIAWFDRPKGKLFVDPSMVEAKQSQVEGAGLGLYATTFMPEGTKLGTYPGVIRPTNNYMKKYANIPDAGTYAWRFTDNEFFIDPTSKEGQLYDYCLGGTDDLPLSNFLHQNVFKFKTSTLLARINEPPIGGSGCNVRTEENIDAREVVFSLSKDVYVGEELFMDYGLSYDRSGYS
jgi:hypothetical protein